VSSRAPGPALRSQVVGFALVGIAGTVGYLAVYALLRTVLPAHAANVTARIAAAVPTTWANGRHTFRSRVPVFRMYAGALVVLAAGVVITGLPLAAEQALRGADDRTAELLTLTCATAVATVVRFLLLRNWLFRPRSGPPAQRTPARADHHLPQLAGS
jgi:putative flippase GtrA